MDDCSEIKVGVGAAAATSSGYNPTQTESPSPFAQTQTFERDGEGNREQFPTKLYEMLEIVESLGLSHAVSWLPDGRSFKVKNPAQFMDLVAPRFFKFTQYRSFQRQLNLWGFHRVASGKCKGDWYHDHELFISGKPELISKMRRTRIKGTKKHQPRNKPRAQLFPSKSVRGYDYDQEQEDTELWYEEICNSTIQVCNTSDPRVSPEWFGSEDIDIVADREITMDDPCRSSRCAQAHSAGSHAFEPLPAHAAGILDINMNTCELAEFGQLLDCLM